MVDTLPVLLRGWLDSNASAYASEGFGGWLQVIVCRSSAIPPRRVSRDEAWHLGLALRFGAFNNL